MTTPGDVAADADTLAASAVEPSPGAPRQVDPVVAKSLDGGFERYETRYRIGAGGMGEVTCCSDARIGRDVAVKVVRESDFGSLSEVRRRFEREARIQGQLEHPNIVPVYDLGVRPDGGEYFTMKRVNGLTLQEIVGRLRAGDADLAARFPRRRLIGALGSVCMAVAYANVRGVIHRDLKPANIILGDFGEVYVLDWGIAKLRGEASQQMMTSSATAAAATQVGSLLGTPGYMPPEQARGDEVVDERADVYALGMILFELLTLERYHQGRTVEQLIASTLTEGPARPIERTPDRAIPFDLDAACAAATALEPSDRLASAHELHRLLEAHLAGDRDAEQRHQIAEAHVRAAETKLDSLRGDPERDIEARTLAIRELIAAMSIDPGDASARRTMVRALTEDAPTLPASAIAELNELRSTQRRRAARNATLGLCVLYALIPLLVWNGIRDVHAFGAMIGMLSICTATAFAISRSRRIPPTYYIGLMVLMGALIGTTSTLFGPFLVTPALALACAAALIAGARLAMAWRATVIAIAIAAVLIPALVQWHTGTWPYRFTQDGLVIVSGAIELTTERCLLVLVLTSVATVLLPSMLIGRSVDVLHRAEEHLFTQAWRLRKVFPEAG